MGPPPALPRLSTPLRLSTLVVGGGFLSTEPPPPLLLLADYSGSAPSDAGEEECMQRRPVAKLIVSYDYRPKRLALPLPMHWLQ